MNLKKDLLDKILRNILTENNNSKYKDSSNSTKGFYRVINCIQSELKSLQFNLNNKFDDSLENNQEDDQENICENKILTQNF
ncbi:MAG: hypothetical protein HQK49_05660 [Oligoflexia bacterium]|nr:hypothetical protein [Oligoflexia bacterium]